MLTLLIFGKVIEEVQAPTDIGKSEAAPDLVDVNNEVPAEPVNTPKPEDAPAVSNGLVDLVQDNGLNPVLADAPIAGNAIEDVKVEESKPEEKSFIDLAAIEASSIPEMKKDEGVPLPDAVPGPAIPDTEPTIDDLSLDDNDDNTSFDPVDFS